MPTIRLKPFLIGQAPSLLTSKKGSRPFDGWSGERIALMIGRRRREMLERWVEARNLINVFPGRCGEKGDHFDVDAARLAADAMMPQLRGRTAIIAGRKVADAFGIDAPFLSRVEKAGVVFWPIPHPSGVNLWYNDPLNAERVERLLRKLILERREP